MLNVIIFSLIGGIVSLIGGALLLRSNREATFLAKYATPFAAGALLTAAFLDLLKEGIHESEAAGQEADPVLWAALLGMLTFFILERLLDWFHHHHEHEDGAAQQADPKGRLIIIGDALHNILDGVAIAAAFLIDVPTGIVTTVAVAAHEIPQEIGDFGLLLKKGYSRGKVLLYNAISALATTAAAVTVYAIGSEENLPLPVILGLTAGFFIYIAASDIIPSIHEQSKGSRLFNLHTLLLILGVVVMAITTTVAHRFIEHGGHERSDSGVLETCPEGLPGEALHSCTVIAPR